jgi:hypothetical protein
MRNNKSIRTRRWFGGVVPAVVCAAGVFWFAQQANSAPSPSTEALAAPNGTVRLAHEQSTPLPGSTDGALESAAAHPTRNCARCHR